MFFKDRGAGVKWLVVFLGNPELKEAYGEDTGDNVTILLKSVYSPEEAAEKLSETQQIDKNEYVKRVLASANVKLTDTVNAIIEGCVLELDLMISGLINSNDDGGI